mgnify:CR=1 FL=1
MLDKKLYTGDHLGAIKKSSAECRRLSTYYKVAMTLTWLVVMVSGIRINTAKDLYRWESLTAFLVVRDFFAPKPSAQELPDKIKQLLKKGIYPLALPKSLAESEIESRKKS